MPNSSQSVTTLGVGSIIGWLLGLLIIFLGLGTLSLSFAAGIVTLLAGLMLIPGVWTVSRRVLNFQLSLPLRLLAFVILMVIAYSLYSATTV